jgi:hypothetical protein
MCPAAPRPGVTRELKYTSSSLSLRYLCRYEVGGWEKIGVAFHASFNVIILALIAVLEKFKRF